MVGGVVEGRRRHKEEIRSRLVCRFRIDFLSIEQVQQANPGLSVVPGQGDMGFVPYDELRQGGGLIL